MTGLSQKDAGRNYDYMRVEQVFDTQSNSLLTDRILDALSINYDLSKFHSESWKKIFRSELPKVIRRLLNDHSPEVQAEAVVTLYRSRRVTGGNGLRVVQRNLGKTQHYPWDLKDRQLYRNR